MKVKDCGLGKCVLDMTPPTQETKPKWNIWLHMTKMVSLAEDTIIELERAWRTSFSLTIRSMCVKTTTSTSYSRTVIRNKNCKFPPTVGKNVDDYRYLKKQGDDFSQNQKATLHEWAILLLCICHPHGFAQDICVFHVFL